MISVNFHSFALLIAMWSFIFQWCFTFTIMYSYIQIFLYSYTLTTSKYSMHRFEALAYGDFSNVRCNWWLLNHSYITWYTSLLYFFFLCSQTNVVFAFPSVWPRAVPLLNRPHFSDKLYMQVRFICSFCCHSYHTTYMIYQFLAMIRQHRTACLHQYIMVSQVFYKSLCF